MGARAGYTLATGLVIGVGAATGALSLLIAVLPEAAIAPILVFIGLEITAQGFLATPPRHGAAVALTFVPVVAAGVLIESGSLLSALGTSAATLRGEAALGYQALLVLGNGFILTAVLWGWALAAIIDRRLALAGLLFGVAGAATLVGAIHSPLATGGLFWPWAMPSWSRPISRSPTARWPRSAGSRRGAPVEYQLDLVRLRSVKCGCL